MNPLSDATGAEQVLGNTGFLERWVRLQPGFWELPPRAETSALKAFRSWEGVSLFDRAKLELTTSHFETGIYRAFLEQALPEVPPGLLLEIGAGDGRITHILCEQREGVILACDCNRPALSRLYRALTPRDRDRVLVLCCSIEDLPLRKLSLAGTVAIESLYYLGPRLEETLATLAHQVVPGGRLIHAEPTLEGYLIHCLAIGDWEGALTTAEQRKVEGAYRGLSRAEVEQIHDACGWRTLNSGFTPLANLILVNRLIRSELSEVDRLDVVRRVRSAAPWFEIPRCILYTAAPVEP